MTYQLHLGDSREVLQSLADCSIDSVVTDPPYGLSFMGRTWDYDVPSAELWREVFRVLKSGGHVLSFGGARTYHRLAVEIEDAGFEIRDQIMWLYGSGFPKGRDVGKAIDKTRTEDVEPIRAVCRFIRAAMDAQGRKSRDLTAYFGDCDPRLIAHWAARDTDSQPYLPTPSQWAALKSLLGLSDEMDAEVARLNARKNDVSDTWKTADVIGEYEGEPGGFGEHRFNVRDRTIRDPSDLARQWQGWGTSLKPAHEPIVVARKPLQGTVAANVAAHGTGALNIAASRIPANDGTNLTASEHGALGRWPSNCLHDGSDEVMEAFAAFGKSKSKAARFFYCAKASKADRGEGNGHPTVKPTALMQYLVRLVTPPGGVVLDPFMGSGSTGKAAMLEGFRFVGIEREAEHHETAERRIKAALLPLFTAAE